MKKILILGLGNILLSDEGFGVHAVEYLKERYEWPDNVRLMDGGTRGLLLMMDLMDNDLVIILDIVRAGNEPGTMCMIENDGLNGPASFPDSAHQSGIADVLASCELIGCRPEALVFGFEPYDYETVSASLTAEAREKLPAFCALVVEELRKRGYI